MNTFIQKITAVLALAFSLSLTSCEKDSLLTPNPLGSARLGNESDEPIPSPKLPPVHRLTKHGNSTLSYSADGHLQKVITVVNRGSIDYHTDYTYTPGSIRAASYQGAILVRDETFILDVSKRCVESIVKSSSSDTHWIYTYNAKGQLSSCQKTNSSIGGTTYTYNTDGDLIKATVATTISEAMNITFSYVVPTLDDNHSYITYPLNLNVPMLPERDTFLPIFGRTGQHLVKWVYYSPSGLPVVTTPGDRFYSYVIPSDGYVVERNMAHTFDGSSIEKIHYAYELAEMGLR